MANAVHMPHSPHTRTNLNTQVYPSTLSIGKVGLYVKVTRLDTLTIVLWLCFPLLYVAKKKLNGRIRPPN